MSPLDPVFDALAAVPAIEWVAAGLALGYLGFAPMLVSPTLWRTWHNQVHHGKTNQGNSDPDGFGTLSRYEKAPSTRFVARLAPGSRHPVRYFFFA